MLGQPVAMVIPEVIGFGFKGKLKEGVTATDLVLTCTQMLQKARRGREVRRVLRRRPRQPLGRGPRNHRQHGARVRRHLRLLPRRPRHHQVPEGHRPRARSAWRSSRPTARPRACGASPAPSRSFTDVLELDLSTVEPSLAGPKRPQDRVPLDRRSRRASPPGLTDIVKGADPKQRVKVAGDRLRARQRRRGDRRHHLLHQHLQPVRADRRGPGGAQRAARRASRPSRG